LEAVRRSTPRIGLPLKRSSFFEDVPARLAAAHLVISRPWPPVSRKIAIVRAPCYTGALRDGRRGSSDRERPSGRGDGSAWIMTEADFTPPALAQRLQSLISEPEQLVQAAAVAFAQGRPAAARGLADIVAELAGGANGHAPFFRENAA